MAERRERPLVLTVGHSTRSAAELVDLLRGAKVELLVDVRRFPGSRRHPQFGRESLRATLAAAGIRYEHEEELGGRRLPRPDSPNGGLRDEAFRGYADHTLTPAFRRAAERLLSRAAELKIALMCAEAEPARCHRTLLADHLVACGAQVRHLLWSGSAPEHALTASVVVQPDGSLRYPGRSGRELGLFGPLDDPGD